MRSAVAPVSLVVALAALCLLAAPCGRAQMSVVAIPQGTPSKIDGVMDKDEWKGAAQVAIQVEPSWIVKVFLKHDAATLYLAFQGVRHDDKRLFPEVLVDPALRGGEKWSPGQFWLHVSNNLCEGSGEYNNYKRDGVFQCAHTKPGWEGNNPPRANEPIKIRISFAKMGVAASKGTKFGLALDVTDATGESDQLFRYWPTTAQIGKPATWGVAVID